MTTQLDLKEIERKAFRATYQDGLWDMYLGVVIAAMAIFVYRPEDGYHPANIVLAITAIGLAYSLFWAGKRFITLPRMGQVRFGLQCKRRKVTLALILGAVVLVQVGIVSLSVLGWLNPAVGAQINALIGDRDVMDLVVASIGALFVGPSMVLMAYFNDFPRGYYIAIMMSLAVFLMIWLNRPIYPIIIGGLIILPGLVLFVRFLQKHPLRRDEAIYG